MMTGPHSRHASAASGATITCRSVRKGVFTALAAVAGIQFVQRLSSVARAAERNVNKLDILPKP
jgi:hypothetical protein